MTLTDIRSFASPDMDLNGKSILITGGTGSFGQRFTRHIVKNFTPRRLVIYSRDELKQYEMAAKFPPEKYPFIRFFIGDVRDLDRLKMAFREIDYVVHCAALKQVSIAEYNPFECIRTNVVGAENIVTAALRNDVKRVVALSTDKAANPINLYGASKLASDKIFIAANNLSGSIGTRFSVVRYGNVVGSRGSVVPLFRKLLAEGADSLPITDPRMTRFWITLAQGVNFVMSSMAMMRGGEIFVPKIPSMKVVDLARCLAPGKAHRVIGIRPGEKLHETLIPLEMARHTLEIDDRYIIEPSFKWWSREAYSDNGANPVDENFSYASDTNDEWLNEEALLSLLQGADD